MLWFLTTYTLISWTISPLLCAQRLLSELCGRFLSLSPRQLLQFESSSHHLAVTTLSRIESRFFNLLLLYCDLSEFCSFTISVSLLSSPIVGGLGFLHRRHLSSYGEAYSSSILAKSEVNLISTK